MAKYYDSGLTRYSNILLPTTTRPLDDRYVVSTFSDLTTPSTWNTSKSASPAYTIYNGMPVYVRSDRRVYLYVGADGSVTDIADESKWLKVPTTQDISGISSPSSAFTYGGTISSETYATVEGAAGTIYSAEEDFTIPSDNASNSLAITLTVGDLVIKTSSSEAYYLPLAASTGDVEWDDTYSPEKNANIVIVGDGGKLKISDKTIEDITNSVEVDTTKYVSAELGLEESDSQFIEQTDSNKAAPALHTHPNPSKLATPRSITTTYVASLGISITDAKFDGSDDVANVILDAPIISFVPGDAVDSIQSQISALDDDVAKSYYFRYEGSLNNYSTLDIKNIATNEYANLNNLFSNGSVYLQLSSGYLTKVILVKTDSGYRGIFKTSSATYVVYINTSTQGNLYIKFIYTATAINNTNPIGLLVNTYGIAVEDIPTNVLFTNYTASSVTTYLYTGNADIIYTQEYGVLQVLE